MKRSQFFISLYLIIPVIFAGLSIISALVTFSLADHYIRAGFEAGRPVLLWIFIIAFLSFACGWVLVKFLLEPSRRFVEQAAQFPAVSAHEPSLVDERTKPDELSYMVSVFDTVTDVLSKVDARQAFPEFIGESRALRGVMSQIIKVAPTDSTVLILGESGTGKELVASSIYNHSRRNSKPFVKINCAAIPAELLESELFGHEKGAFTGAQARKPGRFDLANKGTIFLDEIGDMPLALQAKILRVLQEKEFDRVGGTTTVKVDVRIIAATNKNLGQMVKDGKFREDLYFRLNVFSLCIPPLRERKDDIQFLSEYFIDKLGKGKDISPEAMEILMDYDWPGNIREFQNILERALVICDEIIEKKHLPKDVLEKTNMIAMSGEGDKARILNMESSLDLHIQNIEKKIIINALKNSMGVQAEAARNLKITQRSLWHRVKKYNIDPGEFKPNN